MTGIPQSMTDQRVIIAVLTYRRPTDLVALLPELLDQAGTVSLPVEIVVVDNDPDAGARILVTETNWWEAGATNAGPAAPIRYVHEPSPGIAAARNRALHEGENADLLIFIDDDERPSSHWLVGLLNTYDTYRPAGVVGPVLSQYDIEPDQWIRAGGFFERRRFSTGTSVSLAATNNLLLDLSQVRHLGLSFDERFGLSGGSDSLFTRQLHQRGGKMIWCDEAIVIDVVPADRLTREWVLRRAFRMGNAWSRINLDDTINGKRMVMRLNLQTKGAARVCGGIVRYLTGSLLGQLPLRARGLRTVARGAGMLAGSVGFVYHEYKRG